VSFAWPQAVREQIFRDRQWATGLLRRLQAGRVCPIVQMQGGVGLPGFFHELVPLRTGWKGLRLGADIVRKHPQAILEGFGLL
jgi:hypothetical protein